MNISSGGLMREWTWKHDWAQHVCLILADGEIWAAVPHEAGIRNPSVEDRAQFIIDACNEADKYLDKLRSS